MRTTTGNSGLGCCVHRTAHSNYLPWVLLLAKQVHTKRTLWSNHLRATKLWSRSHSCALFSSPMACSASCSFFRCNMFFMPSSCQHTTHSLWPAPVNRHVLYALLQSTNMFFMQAPVNSRILYAQLLLTDTFFVYDPCHRTTHSLCTAPINSQ